MEEANSGIYLEDFVTSLEMLPNDARRDFELMKEMDRECIESSRQLAEMEQQCLLLLQRRKREWERLSESQRLQIDNECQQVWQQTMAMRQKTQSNLYEKSAIAVNLGDIINQFSRKLDTDLAFFETKLKSCGEFETKQGAEPGSEVAFTVATAGSEGEKTYILGRVIAYHADTAEYDILDVDDSKTFLLPENQVIDLDMMDSQRKLTKGEIIHALYPDTTSFYPAIITQAPRRTATGGEPSLVVQFAGDEDAQGNIPFITVPLKYAIRVSASSNRSSFGGGGAALL